MWALAGYPTIVTLTDECGISGTVPGGRVTFWANLSYPASSTVKFQWSVTGHGAVADQGKTNGQSFVVVLGDTPGEVDIKVVVTTVDGESWTSAIKYMPDTLATALGKRVRCLLLNRYRFKIPWPIGPGDPPPREITAGAYSREQLRGMQIFATRLLDLTTQLLALRESLHQGRIM